MKKFWTNARWNVFNIEDLTIEEGYDDSIE